MKTPAKYSRGTRVRPPAKRSPTTLAFQLAMGLLLAWLGAGPGCDAALPDDGAADGSAADAAPPDGGAGPTAPVCSAGSLCWEHPLPQGNSHYAVWGSSASDVWMVGSLGGILHSDGQRLTAVDSGTAQSLTGVWGTSPSNIWAVGNGGTILRWNGATWSPEISSTTTTLNVCC